MLILAILLMHENAYRFHHHLGLKRRGIPALVHESYYCLFVFLAFTPIEGTNL
jgi:hypothetical protein